MPQLPNSSVPIHQVQENQKSMQRNEEKYVHPAFIRDNQTILYQPSTVSRRAVKFYEYLVFLVPEKLFEFNPSILLGVFCG